MCQPKSKGGKRCPKHIMMSAQKDFNAEPSVENYEALQEATKNYHMTTAGIKALRASDDPGDKAKAEMFEELRQKEAAEKREQAREERKRKAAEARAEQKAREEEEKRYLNSTEGKARTVWQQALEKQTAAWSALQEQPENTENSELREEFERSRLEENMAFDAYVEARDRAARVRYLTANPGDLKGFLVSPVALTERLKVVSDPETSSEALDSYANDADSVVREKVAGHKNASPETLHKFADDPNQQVMAAMVHNPNVRFATLKKAMRSALPSLRLAIVNTKEWIASTCDVKDRSGRVLSVTKGRLHALDQNLTLKVVERLSRHHDASVRRAAALNPVWEELDLAA